MFEFEPSGKTPNPGPCRQRQKHLDELRAADPKTVKEAERFFFLN
jgi:hypothetical protein